MGKYSHIKSYSLLPLEVRYEDTRRALQFTSCILQSEYNGSANLISYSWHRNGTKTAMHFLALTVNLLTTSVEISASDAASALRHAHRDKQSWIYVLLHIVAALSYILEKTLRPIVPWSASSGMLEVWLSQESNSSVIT